MVKIAKFRKLHGCLRGMWFSIKRFHKRSNFVFDLFKASQVSIQVNSANERSVNPGISSDLILAWFLLSGYAARVRERRGRSRTRTDTILTGMGEG